MVNAKRLLILKFKKKKSTSDRPVQIARFAAAVGSPLFDQVSRFGFLTEHCQILFVLL